MAKAPMLQHSKATATLPEGFAPPTYKTIQGSCRYEIPRKEQGAEAKLWKVPAKAKSLVCNQQKKAWHGHSVKQDNKTRSLDHKVI